MQPVSAERRESYRYGCWKEKWDRKCKALAHAAPSCDHKRKSVLKRQIESHLRIPCRRASAVGSLCAAIANWMVPQLVSPRHVTFSEWSNRWEVQRADTQRVCALRFPSVRPITKRRMLGALQLGNHPICHRSALQPIADARLQGICKCDSICRFSTDLRF